MPLQVAALDVISIGFQLFRFLFKGALQQFIVAL